MIKNLAKETVKYVWQLEKNNEKYKMINRMEKCYEIEFCFGNEYDLFIYDV